MTPGPVWQWLLEWLAPEEHRDALLGDATEELGRRASEDGRAQAFSWYRRQVLRSVVPGLVHKARRAGASLKESEAKGEMMSRWIKDFQLALRGLEKRPGFSVTVIATLALGIGATTALFGVFRTVFLEPIPLPESENLVVVMERTGTGCCGPASALDYQDWVERNRSFEGMAALSPRFVTLTGGQEAERIYSTEVTPSAFEFLGVEPLLGRALVPEDVAMGGVVVLGHGLWQRSLGGNPAVLGSTLEIDGAPHTVVGIMPPDFDVPSPWARTLRHQLYLPFSDDYFQESRGSHSFPVIARLANGVSLESAQADMDRIMRELADEYPRTNAERTSLVFTVHGYLFGDVGQQLGLILAAAGLVLLIACGNVAGLQLARAAARETELAVRSALGASRRAMVRLLFSESLLLAILGGALGVVVAMVGVKAMLVVLPSSIPRIDQVRMDGWALAFAVLASAFTAVVFGMLPALLASRTDVASGVREGGFATLAPGKERLRDYFIVGQIALGLVLANGAGVLIQSYAEVRGQEYGFDTEGVLTLALNPAGPRYETQESREAFFEDAAERVGSVPGVVGVGLVTRLPLSGGSNGNVLVEGAPARSSSDEGPLVEVTSITGDYFAAMGIPLLMGRTLEPDDSISVAVGVVINRAMADEVWPGEDPLGKRFSFRDDPPEWLTVVGMVGNVRQWGPEQPPLSQVYFPFTRGWTSTGYLVASVAGQPTAVVPEVRRAIRSADPTQAPSDILAMDQRLESAFAQRRFYTTLIALFAIAALFLASAGIYGTVSYFVTRRLREVGIRMALGAGNSNIMGLVLRRGIGLAVWGVAIGLGGVWAVTSLLEGLVYGITATDTLTLIAGCVALAGVAIAASTLPALRALRVSPVLALRAE